MRERGGYKYREGQIVRERERKSVREGKSRSRGSGRRSVSDRGEGE